MKSLKGKLILDGGKLAGSEFHRTVVLICEHDEKGAFGLVLNRSSKHTVREAIDVPIPDSVEDLPVFLGGPVQPQALSVLIRDSSKSGDVVITGLHIAHTLDDVVEPSGELPAQAQFKFFAGYAGWSPGQLENEMKDGAWLTHPATTELVFDPKTDKLWKSILRSKGTKYRLLAEAPDDVLLN
jgi:putative transcriptional regulator